MEIRNDLREASGPLERLSLYAKTFYTNSNERWSHLKNREDFASVYQMDRPIRAAFEKLYQEGRGSADDLADRLLEFNQADLHPTLTDFIVSLENSWLFKAYDLETVIAQAEDAAKSLTNVPWSVVKMIKLSKEQIKLMNAVKGTISVLKNTEIYKVENNIPINDSESPWWMNFDRRIAVFGVILAIIGIIVSL